MHQFVVGGKFHRHVGGIFPTSSKIFQLSRRNVQLLIPMLPLIFGGKMSKMLVDLLKMSKILVDFLSYSEKSVEFFAPNTDWQSTSRWGPSLQSVSNLSPRFHF